MSGERQPDNADALPVDPPEQNWRQMRSDPGDLGIDGIDDIEPGSGELERRTYNRGVGAGSETH